METTLAHMRLIGPARPIDARAIRHAQQDLAIFFPPTLRTLWETWGAGTLLGFFELLDPTESHHERGWTWWRTRLAEHRRTDVDERLWATDDYALSTLTVFAVAPHGGALAMDLGDLDDHDEPSIWYLDAPARSGRVHWLATTLTEAIHRMICGRYRGDIAEVLPPSPAGSWGFPPIFRVHDPQQDVSSLEDHLLDAIAQGDPAAEAAWDKALMMHCGWEVTSRLLDVLGPAPDAVGVGAPELDISTDKHIAWLRRVLRTHRTFDPTYPEESIICAIAELETRDAPRVSVEVPGAPIHLAVRTRDARHAKLLFIDAHNPTEDTITGALQITEFDREGDIQRLHKRTVTLPAQTACVFDFPDIPPSARLQFDFLPDS